MKKLVLHVSPRDPFTFGMIGQDDYLGPALSLLASEPADHIYFLAALDRLAQCDALQLEIARRYPETELHGTIAQKDLITLTGDLTAAYDINDVEAAADWRLRCKSSEWVGRLLSVEPATHPGGGPTITDHTPPSSATINLIKEPALASYGGSNIQARLPEAQQCGIIGEHPALLEAIQATQTIAAHPVPVLIQGQTGTGKELFARYLHACSARSDKPFITVNCSALPEKLVESTLFGHRKGAFTGADRDQSGKFVEANGGTLFLDELAELPLEQQPKLLRALQEGVVEPVGGPPVEVDVRIVTATHRNLAEEVQIGRFREDLYYRLSFAVVRLPALRERRSDIPALAASILLHWNRSMRSPKRLSIEAMERLVSWDWPGNVREMQGVIGRSLMLFQGEELSPDDLKFESIRRATEELPLPDLAQGFSLEDHLNQVRSALILKALDITGQNQTRAAHLLGLSPQAVSKFLHAQGGE